GMGQVAPAHVKLRMAIDTARELDDNRAFFAAAGWALRNLNALTDRERVYRLVPEILARTRDGARSDDLGRCLYYAGLRLLGKGDRHGAELAWREFSQVAERSRDATLVLAALTIPAIG